MVYNETDVIDFINDNDVKFIRLAFCDVFGVQKNISIMPRELDEAFTKGIAIESSSIHGFGMQEKIDLFLVPDANTLSLLPWRPSQGKVVRFFCNIKYADGKIFELDTRNILKIAIKEAKDLDFSMEVGAESEFYLFKRDENGEATDIPLDNGTYMDMAPIDKSENIRREICLTLEEMGIQPKTSNHEHGPGQNKIDFKESDVLSSADNVMTFRTVVETLAARNGAYATFAPKPIADREGNGFHIKLFNSLNSKHDFGSFMAGILENIKGITLFLNPSKESYDRLGSLMAPKYISWSSKNITPLIRVPEEKGFTWIELRSPDSSANPYLAYALILYAGLDGVKRKLSPANESNLDKIAGLEKLPSSLKEAYSLVSKSSLVSEKIPEILVEKYMQYPL